MNKSLLLFVVTFVLAAGVTLAVRTARHDPHPDPTAGNAELRLGTPAPSLTLANTVCALCGMAVDPSIKPAEYQGRLVGFGCAACPPRFAKDPERWGPSALRNEVLKD